MEKEDFIHDNEDANDNEHWKDPALDAGMNRRANEMEFGVDKGRSWEEVSRRIRWEAQFKEAIARGEKPEKDSFDGLENDFDKNKWTW